MSNTFSASKGDRGRFYYRSPDPLAGQPIPHVVWADLDSCSYYECYKIDYEKPQEVDKPTFILSAAGLPFRFRVRRPFLFFREVVE